MPDNSLTEERQSKMLIKRWRINTLAWYLFATFGLATCITLLTFPYVYLFVMLIVLYMQLPLSRWASKWSTKLFLRSLTDDERESLQHFAQKELLRASVKTKDDTLLRAAQSADNTPQDQLLRPTQPNNKT